MCNIEKYVKKLIKSDSQKENSHRNVFHATFIVKHAEIIVTISNIKQ